MVNYHTDGAGMTPRLGAGNINMPTEWEFRSSFVGHDVVELMHVLSIYT